MSAYAQGVGLRDAFIWVIESKTLVRSEVMLADLRLKNLYSLLSMSLIFALTKALSFWSR